MNRRGGSLVWMMLVAVASAQKTAPAPPPVTGVVTGTVICADTQRPARFAAITLARKPDADDLKAPQLPPKSDPKHPPSVALLNGRTGLDGVYTIGEVPPGDYYVIARMPGYVLPLPQVSGVKAARDLDTVMRAMPVVHVGGDRTYTANVSLSRGAVLSGRMQFEDGTPIAGMWVQAQPAEGGDHTYLLQPGYLSMAIGYARFQVQTDDDGRFRIAGFPPGKYVLSTMLEMAGGFRMNNDGSMVNGGRFYAQMLTAYAPGVFRKTDARVYELKATEQVGDANVEVALDRLHTVRGRVLAKEDRHKPDHVGIEIVDKTDKEFGRSPTILLDGSFHFDYVPEGTYTIKVFGGEDVADAQDDSDKGQKRVRSYANLETSVIVGDQDVTLDDLLLETAKPGDSVP